MKKKIVIILGIVFLVIIATEFAAYWYFSRSVKKEIKINEGLAENIPAEENADEDNNAKENLISENTDESLKPNPNTDSGKKSENIAPVKKEEKAYSRGIINHLVDWGFQKATGRKIDTVIIHTTYNALGGDRFSVGKILNIYESYGVAPHYLIDRDGKIYRLVEEKNIAFHAGVSEAPDGRENINDFSIGIEVINSKTEKPTDTQYDSLKKLLADLKKRYSMKYVLGHSDIAPGRKDDPWNLEWNRIK